MVSLNKSAVDPTLLAAAWFARLTAASVAAMPREEPLPEGHVIAIATLAAFAALALAEGRTVVVLVPDDEPLPDISNTLDLSLRPLCLVLPGADFAARIALRATLSLMKSRLSRDGDDEQSAAWTRQRERIAANEPLWRQAQDWSARNDRSDWPADVAELFPARILPIAAWRALHQKSADITVLYRCDAPAELVAAPSSLLRIGTRAESPRHRALALGDEDARLHMELAQLTQDVAELELELATAQAEVADFTRRYYQQIGRRMVELDALQARIAREQAERAPDNPEVRAEARQKTEQAEQSARENERFAKASKDEPSGFRPTGDVKRLFRQLAQKIHPDRAADEADRAWRTQLMSEANRAYRAGDERTLREVATLWEEGQREQSPAATSAATKAAVSPAPTLLRQVERMRARFAEIEGELHRLFGSRLYELFIAARQARRQGRDLLQEMADKLDENLARLRTAAAPDEALAA